MLSLSQLKCLSSKEVIMLLKHIRKRDFLFLLNRDFHLVNICGSSKSNIKKEYSTNIKKNFSNEAGLPTQAQVVICGGGVVANSVAYHLTENGWKDVVVLEQGRVCEGTSHFGSGTLGLFKPLAEKNIILYSTQLYQQLQDKGYDIDVQTEKSDVGMLGVKTMVQDRPD